MADYVCLTRAEAEMLGIIVCANCGWRENNHFDFEPRKCAHDATCPGYVEGVRFGRLVE